MPTRRSDGDTSVRRELLERVASSASADNSADSASSAGSSAETDSSWSEESSADEQKAADRRCRAFGPKRRRVCAGGALLVALAVLTLFAARRGGSAIHSAAGEEQPARAQRQVPTQKAALDLDATVTPEYLDDDSFSAEDAWSVAGDDDSDTWSTRTGDDWRLFRARQRQRRRRQPEEVDDDTDWSPDPDPGRGGDLEHGDSKGKFLSQCEAWNGLRHGSPVFRDPIDLEKAGWGPYFRAVYGEVPTSRYPICIGSLWFLHRRVLEMTRTPYNEPKRCPKEAGDFYVTNNKYQPPDAAWIFHPPPFGVAGERGLLAHTWIEVSHAAQNREAEGSWFMFSMGSGIWFNLGRTIVFDDHAEAHEHFCGKNCKRTFGDIHMSREAANQGYDSIQFLAHPDDQWRCKKSNSDNKLYKRAMNIEIVAVKLHGHGACGNNAGAFRTGWNANRSCDCDNDATHLNCRGVGLSMPSVPATIV